jgi:FkbM family methyltransferase
MLGRPVQLGSMRFRVADDQPTFWSRFEAGNWEPGTLAVLDAHVGPGTLFIDLGAWVGPTALYAALRGATVIAVEADPVAVMQLQRNLAVNPALSGRIGIIPKAVHATAGHVTLGARRKPGDSMSSLLLGRAVTTWQAETVTPGELAALVPAAAELFVKIDIEGAEYDLLPALAPLLARPGTRALVSFHPRLIGAADSEAKTRRALGPFAGWLPFAVEAAGAVARVPDPAALAAGADGDEWLFVMP